MVDVFMCSLVGYFGKSQNNYIHSLGCQCCEHWEHWEHNVMHIPT